MVSKNFKKSFMLFTILAVFFFQFFAFAGSQNEESLFSEAVQCFNNKNYEESYSKFKSIKDLTLTEEHTSRTLKYFYLAESLVELSKRNIEKESDEKIRDYYDIVIENKNKVPLSYYETSLFKVAHLAIRNLMWQDALKYFNKFIEDPDLENSLNRDEVLLRIGYIYLKFTDKINVSEKEIGNYLDNAKSSFESINSKSTFATEAMFQLVKIITDDRRLDVNSKINKLRTLRKRAKLNYDQFFISMENYINAKFRSSSRNYNESISNLYVKALENLLKCVEQENNINFVAEIILTKAKYEHKLESTEFEPDFSEVISAIYRILNEQEFPREKVFWVIRAGAFALLAECYYDSKRYDEAMSFSKKALEEYNNKYTNIMRTPEIWVYANYTKGLSLFKKDNYDEALKTFDNVNELNIPEEEKESLRYEDCLIFGLSELWRGRCLILKEDYVQAKAVFEKLKNNYAEPINDYADSFLAGM